MYKIFDYHAKNKGDIYGFVQQKKFSSENARRD